MKKKDVIGSTADQQMDAFWQEYRQKLSPQLKREDQDEEEEEEIPHLIILLEMVNRRINRAERIKSFLRLLLLSAWVLVLVYLAVDLISKHR